MARAPCAHRGLIAVSAPFGTIAAVVLVGTATWLVVTPVAADRLRGLPGPRLAAQRPLGVWAGYVRRIALPGPGRRRRQAAERMRAVHALSALASELEAGQPPHAALRQCADDPPLWPHALAALSVDADVAAALRSDAREHPVLSPLAVCWQVSAESGAGLATSVASVAASARSSEDTRVALEAELAGPRSTARLLSMLPVVGIGFGVMMGANPAAWLLGTALGRLCLVAAAILIGAGMWWTGRISAAVERLL